MRCKNCNSEVSANMKFCKNCGAPVGSEAENKEMMICSNCGNQMPQDAIFCNDCGQKFTSAPVQPVAEYPNVDSVHPEIVERKKKKGTSPVLYVILGIAIAILIGAVIFIVMNTKTDSNQDGSSLVESQEKNKLTLSVDDYPSETESNFYVITGSASVTAADAVLTIDGRQIATVTAEDGNVYWEREVSFADGENVFEITLADENGVSKTEKVKITYNPWSDDDSEEYLFPSDRVYITENDLYGKTKEEVALIRNEIYARHGYIFNTEQYAVYFSAKSWYVPNPNFSEELLNSVELANKDFLVEYEESRGWR